MQPYPPVAMVVNGAEEQSAPVREVPFRFTGTAGEYFRIWIVNVALTIVTLGIYSAWAKVRTKQYFYRHTWIDDSSFEYLANPIPILKGRILVGAFIGLLVWSQIYSLTLYAGMVVVAILLTPLVVAKSLAFNARNSAYRNVRFSFLGNAGESYGVYLQMLLVYALTCGLGYPYAQWRITSFVVQRHLYGDERFEWSTRARAYFRVFAFAGLMAVPVYAALFGVLVQQTPSATPVGSDPPALANTMIVIPLAMYAFFLVPAAFVRANIANVFYGGMRIGPHQLCSNQRFWDLLKIYVTNALAVVASLGLLTPWALVRLARYRAERLTLLARGPLLAGTYDMVRDPSAVGEAAMDLGDFDFDIGA